MDSRAALIDKVRKVLHLEEHAGTVGEATAAAAAATALMRKHNITRLELREPDAFVYEELFDGDCRIAVKWKVDLLHALASHNFCKSVYSSARLGAPACLHLFGEQEAVGACAYLYRRLVVQINVLTAYHLRQFHSEVGGKRWRARSFRLGVVNKLSIRLAEQRRADSVLPGTQALVRREMDELLEHIQKHFSNVRRRSETKSLVSRTDYAAGQKVASRLPIGDSNKELT